MRATRISELSTWAKCRRLWQFAYGMNLTPARESLTITRGNLGHASLAALDLGQDWNQALHTEVTKAYNALDQITIEGEESAVSEEHRDALTKLVQSVATQTRRYSEFYPRWDKIHTIERQLQIEVPGIDVPVNLTWDGLVENNDGLWVLERKWVKSFRTQEMMDLDGQIAFYYYAADQLDIKIDGVLVDQIAPHTTPYELNKNGTMSQVKKGDWMSYKEALIEAGLDPDDYGDMEGKLPYQNQFKRDHVYRSKAENERYVLDLVVRAGEMLNPNHAIYMCDDRIRCAQCAFRELCIEDLKGRDMQHIIDAQFIKNTDQYKGE